MRVGGALATMEFCSNRLAPVLLRASRKTSLYGSGVSTQS